MRWVTLFILLGIQTVMYGQESGNVYEIDVRRVNTERAVKVTGIMYVGTEKYKVQTECFSINTAYPCVVPTIGITSAHYEDRNGRSYLQWLTKDDVYGQQQMAEIVDIEVSE